MRNRLHDLYIILRALYPLISRFSGWSAGDSGAHKAGFKTMFAVDFEKHAVENFRLNQPDCPIYQGDTQLMTPQETLDLARIPEGKEFVYLTSAPCQGVSINGKFDPYNELNLLMMNEPYFISKLRPAVFIFENVPGINMGKMKILKAMFAREVEKWLGDYEVQEIELNAMYYGVPQSRKRYILMGVRKDLGVPPSFPEPSSNIVTVQDVLPEVEAIAYGYRYVKTRPANRPAPTLTKTENLRKVVNGKIERLTEPEILKLCGFDDDWKYTGSLNKVYARAGNSIMPPFSKALFDEVYKILQKAGVEPCTAEELKAITDVTVPLSKEWVQQVNKIA